MIPYTEELKQYNVFKLVYLNAEDFSLPEIIDLTIEGDYLVGTLEHFSTYVLIGKVAETQPTNTSEDVQKAEQQPIVQNTKANNPTTGDNILVFTSIFILSAFAVVFQVLSIRRSRFNK